MTRTHTLLLLGTLGLALVLWLIAGGSTPAADPAQPEVTPDAQPQRGPTLHGSGGEQLPGDGPGLARSPLPENAPLVEGAAYLQLDLADYDAALPGDVVIDVTANADVRASRRQLRLRGDAAQMTFDIADLLAAESVDALQLTVSHPLYLPVTAEVSVLGPIVRAYVEMRRALVVTLRVPDEDGTHLRAARATLFRAEGSGPRRTADGRGVRLPVDETDTSYLWGRGTRREKLTLRAPSAGRYALLVHAQGLIPVLRILTLDEALLDLGDIPLREGLAIEGEIRIAGRAAAGVQLLLAPEREGIRFSASGASFRLHAGGVEPGQMATWVDRDGRFGFYGLSPGPKRLTIDTARSRGGETPPLHADFARTIHAPQRDVRIDLPGEWLDVEIAGAAHGQPYPTVYAVEAPAGEARRDLKSLLAEHAWHRVSTDEKGRARLILTPGKPYLITAEHKGMRASVKVLPARGRGRRSAATVTLTRPEDPARLSILGTGPGDEPRKRVRIHLEMLRGPPALVGSTLGVRTIENGASFEEIEPLAPGRWRLRVMGPESNGGPARYVLPAVREFDLRRGQRLQLDVRLTLGGLLRASARNAAGRLLAARCEVFDADDVLRRQRWRGAEAAADAPEALTRDRPIRDRPTLATDGPSTSVTALPPGRYTVQFLHPDYQTLRKEVRLTAGKTTQVEVVLEKR